MPLVFNLEGGYNADNVTKGVAEVLSALSGAKTGDQFVLDMQRSERAARAGTAKQKMLEDDSMLEPLAPKDKFKAEIDESMTSRARVLSMREPEREVPGYPTLSHHLRPLL